MRIAGPIQRPTEGPFESQHRAKFSPFSESSHVHYADGMGGVKWGR